MKLNSPSLARVFISVIKRDTFLALRNIGEFAYPILFFVITVCLYPFAIGPDPELLVTVSPGIIWVSALLATLFALDGMFKSDYDDGNLEQFLLSPHPLPLLVCAKVLAHWLMTGFPLILTALVLGWLMKLPGSALQALFLSLLIGTPGLSIAGAIGSALTVGLKRSGLLLTLIVMPIYVPILIFGTGAIQAGLLQLDWSGQIWFLSAIVVFFITLGPITISCALKISLD